MPNGAPKARFGHGAFLGVLSVREVAFAVLVAERVVVDALVGSLAQLALVVERLALLRGASRRSGLLRLMAILPFFIHARENHKVALLVLF